ncbi:MAG: transcriptional repressor [Fimbriimonas ginsengisoli]|nr:transcriptional repressor [Fimbriimonas ginsengisoli]
MKSKTSARDEVNLDLELLDAAIRYEEHALTELRVAGLRITMPRVQVVRALADAEFAMSAYAIHDKIMKAGGKIDVVSVYRILSTLLDLGIVHRIGLVDGYFPARIFDPQERTTQVVVCERCQRVHELATSAALVEMLRGQGKPANLPMTSIKVELTCSNCSRCQKRA